MPLSNQDQDTEHKLLNLVAAGNEQAFSQLFYLHHQHVAAYVFKLTSSRELAEEVVQDVFIKIWGNRESLTEVKNFRTWLFVISKNHTLNCLRVIIKEKLKQNAFLKHQSLSIISEPVLMNTEGVTDFEEYEKAMDAISQLPPQQQKVFILRRLKNMKYQEIAQQLNVSRETVKSYLKLANSSIAKFIARRRSTLEFWLLILIAFHP
jgi:RNA polymerase sigma-70 factor (family 1)